MRRASDFAGRDLLAVHLVPGVGDVRHDEGNQQRDPEHHLEREAARGTVADGKGTLEVGAGRIVGRPVEAGHEKDRHDDEYRPDAGGPDALQRFRERALIQAQQHKHHARQEQDQYSGHLQEIMQVFVSFQRDHACPVYGITLPQQQDGEPAQEAGEEGECVQLDAAAHLAAHGRILHVVEDVERAEGGR